MSVINHEFKHVFIHNPKAAGTAMESQKWVGGKGHATAAMLCDKQPGYLSWAFVRHPLDRLVSAYHGLKENPGHDTPDVDSMDFVKWVAYLWRGSPATTYHYAQTLPQWHYLYLRGECLVDFVGHYENLEADYRAISKRITGEPQPLDRRNQSTHAPYQAYYTAATIELAQEIYAEDMRLWGYDKNERLRA